MRVLKIITSIFAFGALAYYAYQVFARPNGEIYEVDKIHHVYYKGAGVTKEEAKKVGNYLTRLGYFKNDHEVDVQLSSNKEKSNLKIAYVVDDSKITAELEKDFLFISSFLSDTVFNGKKMLVSLADDHLDEVKNLGFTNVRQINIDNGKGNNNLKTVDNNK